METSSQPPQKAVDENPMGDTSKEWESFEIASNIRRFINLVVDVSICFVCLFLLALMWTVPLDMIAATCGIKEFSSKLLYRYGPIIVQANWIIAIFVYYFSLEYIWGKTLGKFVTRTIVISEESETFTWKQIAIRTLCRFIPFESFSYFFGGNYPVGWHDRLSHTRVVKNQ